MQLVELSRQLLLQISRQVSGYGGPGALLSTDASIKPTPEPEPGGEPVEVPCCGTEFWMYIALCTGLIIFAALMAGLTMALMSLDAMNIQIIEASGTDSERIYAQRISPLLKKRHLLLVTLLVGNATAMEALPLFLDRLVPNWLAIILSVTFVLAFGEILPQAIFTKYRLPIGAYLSGFVWCIECLFFPIAYPISLVLDYMLGQDHPTIYRRAELKELTRMHLIGEDGQGTLTHDEVKIMKGTLDMAEKRAIDAMQPIEKVYMLSVDQVLDTRCMEDIMTSGHSRVPVYLGNKRNVVGLLIVKNIILVDPTKPTKVRDVSKFAIRKIPRVDQEMALFELLHFFGQGRAHLSLVCQPENPDQPLEQAPIVGIITMEDLIEELIQEEILDETDVGVDAAAALAHKFMLKQRQSSFSRGREVGLGANASRSSASPANLGVPASTAAAGTQQQDPAWKTIALAALMKRGGSERSPEMGVRVRSGSPQRGGGSPLNSATATARRGIREPLL